MNMDEYNYRAGLISTHWDLYRDVYGVRPRFMKYDQFDNEELEGMIDIYNKLLEELLKKEARLAQDAIRDFLNSVESLMASLNITRYDAIRWLLQAENCEDDMDYFCYLNNLPSGYINDLLSIQEV